MPENKNIGTIPNLFNAANAFSCSRLAAKATTGHTNANPTRMQAGNATNARGDRTPPNNVTTPRYTPEAIATRVAIHST